jgi:hypothetical protein
MAANSIFTDAQSVGGGRDRHCVGLFNEGRFIIHAEAPLAQQNELRFLADEERVPEAQHGQEINGILRRVT